MKQIKRIADDDRLRASIAAACGWLADVAQMTCERIEDDPVHPACAHPHVDWRGCIRGEYTAATREWAIFAPCWHTGQAARALFQAARLLGDDALRAAGMAAADFVLRQRITDADDEDHGLLLAYESKEPMVTVSGILEALPALLDAHALTGDAAYLQASHDALRWVVRRAFMDDLALFRDFYDPAARTFRQGNEEPGRPLVDDAVFLTVAQRTGDDELAAIFLRTLDRLIADEDPPGNWIRYIPCNPARGNIHPRHAYWWGYPFCYGYEATGEQRYLDAARRAGQWYVDAQRADGGLFRTTFRDFNTYSFGHATSGIACAVKLWVRLWRITGEEHWLAPVSHAINFCLRMQINDAQDPNLRGVIIEKVNPPDGTDRSMIRIRDLGSIFYVQAVCDAFDADVPDALRQGAM